MVNVSHYYANSLCSTNVKLLFSNSITIMLQKPLFFRDFPRSTVETTHPEEAADNVAELERLEAICSC